METSHRYVKLLVLRCHSNRRKMEGVRCVCIVCRLNTVTGRVRIGAVIKGSNGPIFRIFNPMGEHSF